MEEHLQRVDYEYQRAGTAAVFTLCEPLRCWRQASAHNRRARTAWVHVVAGLLERCYTECEEVTLVLDNLNTHTKGAFVLTRVEIQRGVRAVAGAALVR